MQFVSIEAQLRRESWFVFSVGLLLFMLGIWNQSFIDFESRFALFAQEMLRHGPTWFPTTYGEPYPDYPVTGTLLVWLCSFPFGAVTKFSAVLPTALASALNLMLIYRLIARHSRAWAVLTVCLQLMTVTFLAQARSISIDQIVATITVLASYLAYVADRDAQPRLARWLPLVLLAGFAVRGPLGVVIPAGVVTAYYALTAQWRVLVRFGLIAVVVLVVAWGVLLAVAAGYYGEGFMRDVVRMQVVGRLETAKAPKGWYYFTSSFGNYALAFPLAVSLVVLVLPRLLRERRTGTSALLLFLVAWVLVVLVGLSIPHTKKSRYLLPMVPALAALAAAIWHVQQPKILAWLGAALEKIFLAMPALLALALLAARHRLNKYGIDLALPALYGGLALLQIAALGIAFKTDKLAAAIDLPRAAMLAIVAALSMWWMNLLAVEPAMLQTRDNAGFVRQVEALRQQRPAALALFGMLKDGQAINYMVNVDYDMKPVFVRDVAALNAINQSFYLLIEDRQLERLAPAVLANHKAVLRGRFDSHDFSVFFIPSP